MSTAGGPQASRPTWVKALAVLIVVGAIVVAATTGDSIAVRMTLLVVSLDVAVRLWRW